MNDHMKHIDTKVDKLESEVNQLKDEQKESQNHLQQVQIDNSENLVDASDPLNQQKINKFAQMLKTLNGYKTKYKTAGSGEAK